MTWASATSRACREKLDFSLSCVLFVFGESAESFSGFDSSKVSSWCGGYWGRLSRVASALSLTVSVSVQKKAAYYMYLIGIERWNLTSCSSSAVSFGIRWHRRGRLLRGYICRCRHLLDLSCRGSLGLVLGLRPKFNQGACAGPCQSASTLWVLLHVQAR